MTTPPNVTLRSVEFIKSATKPVQFPPPVLPEIAFAGRSNVGKSSLINALVNRRSLVRVSSTPGRTQLINFFEVNGALSLVDLPGYGFARVPTHVRRSWGPMIEGYFASRETLAAVVMIMDLRRGPEDDDMQLIHALPHYGVAPILVFTKADKLKGNKLRNQRRAIADQFGVKPSEIVLTSSTARTGLEEVWTRIVSMSGADLT